MPKEAVDSASKRFGSNLHPTVIYCAAYRSGFSDLQYETSYVYDVFDKTDPAGLVKPENTPIPPQNLVLELRHVGGIQAH
jgi:hypothetical protein